VKRLEGRHALVTGGSRGIGRAIVEALVAEGASVLTVARGAAELEEVAKLSPQIRTAQLDITDRGQVDRLPALLGPGDPLDLLVNNAGVWMERGFLEYTREEWDRTLATNLTAVFDVTRALLPRLLESSSARIVNIAAIDGQRGFPRLAAQCASKAGLIGMTRALAKELWERAITVNAVCPAAIDKEVRYADTPARPPEPKLALPWDVARAVVYLASDEGARITGACLDVHGVGFLAT
jgi:NAD(P)-dependent dehydrogenase (short-subunit alcohol dehydrogenase family)